MDRVQRGMMPHGSQRTTMIYGDQQRGLFGCRCGKIRELCVVYLYYPGKIKVDKNDQQEIQYIGHKVGSKSR